MNEYFCQIRRFYDKRGSKQDLDAGFEDPAIEALLKAVDLGQTARILEVGHGTGRVAFFLLENILRKDCKYTGVDISEEMHRLCQERLRHFEDRVELMLLQDPLKFSVEKNSFDVVVSTYVLDLIPDRNFLPFLEQVRLALKPEGLFLNAGITPGKKLLVKIVMRIWDTVARIRPILVGGCRPQKVAPLITNQDGWQLQYSAHIEKSLIPSEILVAKKIR